MEYPHPLDGHEWNPTGVTHNDTGCFTCGAEQHDHPHYKDEPTKYHEYPDHPLYRATQSVLDAARRAMQEAADAKDVHPDMVDPIADMVVMDLMPFLREDALLRPDPKEAA